jgi:hypothetical protein
MFRLVDVHTGAVVGADKVRYTSSANNVQDTTRVMSDLMDRFTTDAVAAIVLRLFPIKVLGFAGDGTIYVNRGADAGIDNGSQFIVMRSGAELIDPDTGLSFGSAEVQVASVEITSVEASRARARLVSGEEVVVGDVLRVAPPIAPKSEPQVNTPDF